MRSEVRKATSKSVLAARARTLLAARLAWLEGFPLGAANGTVRWLVVRAQAPAEEMRIEGRHLSRATFALNKLRGELAPALPRLFSAPQRWLAAAEARLEVIKGAIHRGAPLPPLLGADLSLPRAQQERARALASTQPVLRPLLGALSWIHAGDPERMRTGLVMAERWSQGFVVLLARYGETPAVVAMLRLEQLAADHGADRVQPLAACLCDARTHEIPKLWGPEICSQILQGLGRRAKAPLPNELPAGTLGKDLLRWCDDLVQQSQRTQRAALGLFALATPLPLIERWALWWQETARLLAAARELRAQRYERTSRQQLRDRLELHRRSAPPGLSAEDLLDALRKQMPATNTTAQLLRALALVPAHATSPGRLQLFIYWSLLGEDSDPPARIATLLAGFARYLSLTQCVDTALAPWTELTTAGRQRPIAAELALRDGERSRSTVLAAYEHLASIAAHTPGLSSGAAERAIELFLLAGDSGLAARLLASWRASDDLHGYHSPAAIKLAAQLCRDRPERFAAVLAALSAQEDQAELHPSRWPAPLLALLSSGELGEIVRETIVARQLAGLLLCGAKAVVLDAAGVQPLPQPTGGEAVAPGWVEHYPPQLRPALCRLAAVDEHAETRAERWLADDLPAAERLEREIGAIETRLAQLEDAAREPALRRRLANLRARLAGPAALSPARLERLRGKLDRAWGRAVLQRWERDLDAHLPAALRRLLAVEEVPAWLSEPPALSLLAAACRLRAPHRQLAYRLFRLRCGPPPWDLRDAPQNRRFMAAHPEVDWQPWIDGMGIQTVDAANGRQLRLALEDDPLEIFRMGAHFKTCLSPGAFNYFSVFANAADVNKRVLYARDGSGNVVGRCLLALTAEAELLTFEAYCHDGSARFDRICTAFAEQLARRMRTRLTSRGRVPALVAADWYDDGPRDLGRRFAAFEDGSPLRRRLTTVRPSELIAELQTALKPARLNETTLPIVLRLPELTQRAELVVPLLRRVADCRALPEESLLTAARLGVRAGAADLVRRLFLQPLAAALGRAYRADTAEILLAVDPAKLLAVLRRTRERGIRDWLEEVDGDRLESAAAALAALYRPRQAAALWRRLASSRDVLASAWQRQRAREALTAAAAP